MSPASGISTGNIFEALPDRLDDEQFTQLAQGRDVRVVRIVSTGQSNPSDAWQEADDDEWVILLSGAARLVIGSRSDPVDMNPGDWCHIPAQTRHRVDFTDPDEPTVWIAVHFDA